MKNISQEKLFRIEVPLPAIEVQREFSRRVAAAIRGNAVARSRPYRAPGIARVGPPPPQGVALGYLIAPRWGAVARK